VTCVPLDSGSSEVVGDLYPRVVHVTFALFCHVLGRFGKMIAKDLILYDVGVCKSCLPSGRPDVIFLFD
jgi:hypothetical protein